MVANKNESVIEKIIEWATQSRTDREYEGLGGDDRVEKEGRLIPALDAKAFADMVDAGISEERANELMLDHREQILEAASNAHENFLRDLKKTAPAAVDVDKVDVPVEAPQSDRGEPGAHRA